MTRKITISVADDLLAAVDTESRVERLSRSGFFATAAREYLQKVRRQREIDTYVASYRDVPETDEVTTTIRLNPATVPLSRRDGLPEACIANCDNLVTANQDDLLEYITTLSPKRMTEVDHALRFALAPR